MDIEKEIINEKNNELNNQINNEQKNFLDTTFGKIIDNGINIGIRYLLPDLIEDEVIEVKNALFRSGIKDGINTAIDKAMDIGKSAIGIITGKFENVSQIQTAVESGGIIDLVSNVLDNVVNLAQDNDLIDRNIASLIKKGKNSILDNISKNIKDTLTEQARNVEKLEKYSGNWNKYYKEQNFDGMEKEYTKIKKQLNNLVPLEQTIKMAKNIEMVHNLIKNNGHNFNFSQEEKELINNLSY